MSIESIFEKAELDTKSLEFLVNALKANTQQGFDYLKFKQSIIALRNTMNLPEDIAVKSAFATAATMGITKDKLIESIQHYQLILQKEKTEFDNAHAKQKNIKINQKQNETNFLQEKIKAHQAQIAELEKQIKEFQYKIDHADKEIEEARQKIQETKERFDETYAYFDTVLKSDIDTFTKYL
jgi:septal ring factor EnvC (AmiA/AmiB activator)